MDSEFRPTIWIRLKLLKLILHNNGLRCLSSRFHIDFGCLRPFGQTKKNIVNICTFPIVVLPAMMYQNSKDKIWWRQLPAQSVLFLSDCKICPFRISIKVFRHKASSIKCLLHSAYGSTMTCASDLPTAGRCGRSCGLNQVNTPEPFTGNSAQTRCWNKNDCNDGMFIMVRLVKLSKVKSHMSCKRFKFAFNMSNLLPIRAALHPSPRLFLLGDLGEPPVQSCKFETSKCVQMLGYSNSTPL